VQFLEKGKQDAQMRRQGRNLPKYLVLTEGVPTTGTTFTIILKRDRLPGSKCLLQSQPSSQRVSIGFDACDGAIANVSELRIAEHNSASLRSLPVRPDSPRWNPESQRR
jgi:hypothetical protein